MLKNLKGYLKELGFNKNETAVYLSLAKLGEAKASRVAKIAELPRTTVISILNKFVEDNYATSHVYKGVTAYWIESPQVLLDILSNKMAVAEKLKEVLPSIYHADGRFPTAKVFDTKKGIRNFFEKVISDLERGAIIYTIDTPSEGNYSKIFSDDFEKIILSLKSKKGILTKTLVPAGLFSGIAKEKISKQNIIIKEMPVSLKFKAAIWIIGDQIISFSGSQPFLVAIKHESIVFGIKGIYDFLWSISADV